MATKAARFGSNLTPASSPTAIHNANRDHTLSIQVDVIFRLPGTTVPNRWPQPLIQIMQSQD